jgi:hypothetical protein
MKPTFTVPFGSAGVVLLAGVELADVAPLDVADACVVAAALAVVAALSSSSSSPQAAAATIIVASPSAMSVRLVRTIGVAFGRTSSPFVACRQHGPRRWWATTARCRAAGIALSGRPCLRQIRDRSPVPLSNIVSIFILHGLVKSPSIEADP